MFWVLLKELLFRPHWRVPGTSETARLFRLMRTQGRVDLAPRWHRGVAYWYARTENGGNLSRRDALKIALMPETSAVEVEIVEV